MEDGGWRRRYGDAMYMWTGQADSLHIQRFDESEHRWWADAGAWLDAVKACSNLYSSNMLSRGGIAPQICTRWCAAAVGS
jgi:hypothetical protein